MKTNGILVTATDTHVGKTVTTFVLATILQKQGIDVGVMKPVQCAGSDAQFLKRSLNLKDPLALINPYLAPEALSPHLAFKRAKIKIDLEKIKEAYEELGRRHEMIQATQRQGTVLIHCQDDGRTCDGGGRPVGRNGGSDKRQHSHFLAYRQL